MRQTASPRSIPIWVRLQTWLIQLLAIVLLVIAVGPVQAQDSPLAGNPVDGYPVTLDGEVLFRVRQGMPGIASAEERAKVINERLLKVANDPALSPDAIQVRQEEDVSVIEAGDQILFSVNDADRIDSKSPQEIANQLAEKMRSKVKEYREERSVDQIVKGIAFAILSTLGLIVFFIFVQRIAAYLLVRIRAAYQADALDWRIQNMQLLGSAATAFVLNSLVKSIRLVLILVSLYLYVPFILSQFPTTKALGNSIYSDIVVKLDKLTQAFVQYLPNLGILILIWILTNFVINLAKLVIKGLGQDSAYPWFYPEWTQPTIRLATFLIYAIAAVIAAPYLPGFGSPAFQGISLFLGALFTLGSSSVVANALAGTILIYTRAFRVGDIIRFGGVTGEVVERSLFVTRVMTFKNEVTTIPNAAILNDQVTNYNAALRDDNKHVLLHTTVTLGYDVPWRKVHEVMTRAAENVPGIASTPRPFVLQTSLNDYNVSYQLNAYTDHPELMLDIYSQLHQNLQDYCNQADIEILSPGFTSIRDGNHITIPADYLPEDYRSPAFQVQNQNGPL